ncbi:acyltransferase family protein [Streptomyces sp. QL37]|uniref:acyltransferase family protein n=1 Tax=Streptomyces sp. QL37 TaxID=2093747 RepID=UPI000CF2B88F|nr:acyltransferase [Streptomyces sp. QL37]PPQ60917.1 hypothetical protein C5F59_32765 [Streptomyces sp. QL37]
MEKHRTNSPLWLAWLDFAGGYAVVSKAPKDYAIVAVGVLPVAVLIAAAAISDVQKRRSLLSGPVMVWPGNISYAFHLLHFFAIQVVLHVIGLGFRATNLSSVGFVLGSLAVSVVAAWALYEPVEKPMMRRFATRRRGEGQPSAVVRS